MRFSSIIAAAVFVGSALASPIENLDKRAGSGRVFTQCTAPKTAALTFDDGPYIYAYDIVNTLNQYGAKGTFFLNGNNWECIYSVENEFRVKYMYNNGHQVASHTWAHKNLAQLTWDQIHDEMWRLEEALIKIVGVRPAMVRPPYGSYNNLVTAAAAARKQDVVNWDFDTGDSAGQSPAYSKSQLEQRIAQSSSTILSLAHETHEASAHEVLVHAIQKLQGAGYRLVTVAECLGLQPYSEYHAPQARDGSWHC